MFATLRRCKIITIYKHAHKLSKSDEEAFNLVSRKSWRPLSRIKSLQAMAFPLSLNEEVRICLTELDCIKMNRQNLTKNLSYSLILHLKDSVRESYLKQDIWTLQRILWLVNFSLHQLKVSRDPRIRRLANRKRTLLNLYSKSGEVDANHALFMTQKERIHWCESYHSSVLME